MGLKYEKEVIDLIRSVRTCVKVLDTLYERTGEEWIFSQRFVREELKNALTPYLLARLRQSDLIKKMGEEFDKLLKEKGQEYVRQQILNSPPSDLTPILQAFITPPTWRERTWITIKVYAKCFWEKFKEH